MKRIYISGAITGNPEYLHEFTLTEERLTEQWPLAEVVNPTRICKCGWGWHRCMIRCIRALLHCNSICMINGWQRSRGARIELFIAKLLKMEICSIVLYTDNTTILYPYLS